MSTEKQEEKDLIDKIRAGGRDGERSLFLLYERNYDLITKYVLNNNGDIDQAKDIFQNVMVVFYENLVSGKYEHNAKISTYLYQVAKNLWINELRKNSKTISLDTTQENNQDNVDTPMIRILEEEKKNYVYELMNQLEDGCRSILNLSIFQKKSMREIAKEMGFQNEQVARNKKYKCLSYLKNLIKNKTHLKIISGELNDN